MDNLSKQMEEFEKGFPDGVYVAPSERHEPVIRMKDLFEYCRKNGKRPVDLSDAERAEFSGYPKF